MSAVRVSVAAFFTLVIVTFMEASAPPDVCVTVAVLALTTGVAVPAVYAVL